MENEIKDKLAEVGLTPDDLTPKELETLKAEIKAEKGGAIVLDGVLSNPAIFYRKRNK